MLYRERGMDAHARVVPAHATHRLRGLVAVRQHPDVVGRARRARVPQPVAEEVDVAVVDLHEQRRVEDAAGGAPWQFTTSQTSFLSLSLKLGIAPLCSHLVREVRFFLLKYAAAEGRDRDWEAEPEPAPPPG